MALDILLFFVEHPTATNVMLTKQEKMPVSKLIEDQPNIVIILLNMPRSVFPRVPTVAIQTSATRRSKIAYSARPAPSFCFIK